MTSKKLTTKEILTAVILLGIVCFLSLYANYSHENIPTVNSPIAYIE